MLRGRRYDRTKQTKGGDRNSKGHSDPLIEPTAETFAKEQSVSANTMKRDGTFAAAVDTLRDYLPDIDQRVMSGALSPGSVRYLRPVCGRGLVGFFCCSCFFDCCCL